MFERRRSGRTRRSPHRLRQLHDRDRMLRRPSHSPGQMVAVMRDFPASRAPRVWRSREADATKRRRESGTLWIARPAGVDGDRLLDAREPGQRCGEQIGAGCERQGVAAVNVRRGNHTGSVCSLTAMDTPGGGVEPLAARPVTRHPPAAARCAPMGTIEAAAWPRHSDGDVGAKREGRMPAIPGYA